MCVLMICLCSKIEERLLEHTRFVDGGCGDTTTSGRFLLYGDSATLLPNLHSFVRIEPHFIAFFDVKGFVKFGNVGKWTVNPHKAG